MLNIETYYSGGGANADPSLSLGGAISSVATSVASATWHPQATAISGVTINSCYGLAKSGYSIEIVEHTGNNGLRLNNHQFGIFGEEVIPTTDETVTLYGGTSVKGHDFSGWINVTVVFATINSETVFRSELIEVDNSATQVLPNISATDSITGKTSYRCIYLKNVDPSDTMNVRLYDLFSNNIAALRFGWDASGVNGTATTTTGVSEPSGVSWSTGNAEITVTLDPSDYIGLWFESHIQPNNFKSAVAEFRLLIGVSI